MVSVEVEKEIDHENKIFIGMTVRQIIFMGLAIVLAILSAWMMNWDINLAMLPIGIIAAVCLAFGWWKPNGENFEKYLIKLIRNFFYHGNSRRYKTKNQYVAMMNEEYQRRRNVDNASKEVQKQIKLENKGKKKEKSQYKPAI